MVDSRCHSFEDASSTNKHHHIPLTSMSRSESSQDKGSIKLAEFATINLSLPETPASSRISLSLEPETKAPSISKRDPRKEGTAAGTPLLERGRSQASLSPTSNAARKAYASPISPDRFIPKRDFANLSSTPYRVNKHPQQLSSREKLLRRRAPGHDPFLPNLHSKPPPSRQRPTPPRLRQRPRQRPRLVIETAVTGGSGATDLLGQIGFGPVWSVGGTSPVRRGSAAPGSSGVLSPSRPTTAPSYAAKFLPRVSTTDEQSQHESRLALALDIDPTTRLLGTCTPCMDSSPSPTSPDYERLSPFVWKDSAWKRVEREHWPIVHPKGEVVPSRPFRILGAPFLKDDFYCSNLAYSSTADVLAVGLGQCVYLWSERHVVEHPPLREAHPSNYVTSLSFSSEDGGRSILAIGRQSGQLTLWGVSEARVRFDLGHPNSVSCVSFRPRTTRRPSDRFPNLEVEVEELAVGDEIGTVWYYAVEWPKVRSKWSWTGSMTLLAKISAHTQQICGLAWSPDDRFLATGGNDNACLLFELREIIPSPPVNHSSSPTTSTEAPETPGIRAFALLNWAYNPRHIFTRHHFGNHLPPSRAHHSPPVPTPAFPLVCFTGTLISGSGRTFVVPLNRHKYHLGHAAAVKAIAFAPWQPTLLATGGGTNDRMIHFYHTRTGVCLAKINVFAQVTSLIWSRTRREIVATFGFAQPEHPYRIAVFAWPSCAQVAVIPWGPFGTSWDGPVRGINYDCGRALWAVSYPGRPPRRSSLSQSEADIFGSGATSPTSPPRDHWQATEHRNESRRRSLDSRATSPQEKEGGPWCTRTMEEGCIIVASSDQTVKFHEVWTGRRKSTGSASGLLGGSHILEGMEGIEMSSSEVIR